jgi:tetratricopeptide (TPR) repeat protein
VVRATVRHWQGRHGDAARDCRSAVALATSAGALDVVAEALVWLDVSELMLGRGDGAHAREALAVLRRLGDRPWQLGRCLNELGMRAWYANDWAGARQAYEQCRAAFSTAGDAWAASLAQANEAEILLEQGHLAQAEPHLRSALRSGRASAAPGHTAFVLALLARLEVRTGRPVEALEHVAEALRLYEEIGEPEEASEARLRLAECRLLAGDARGALADLDTLGAVDRSPLLLRVRGLALAMSGEQEPALAALEESIAVGRAAGSDHDLALGLAALAWWQAQQGLAVPAGADAEQATLRERLGIVAITLPAQPPRAVDLRTPEQRTAR